MVLLSLFESSLSSVHFHGDSTSGGNIVCGICQLELWVVGFGWGIVFESGDKFIVGMREI